MKLYGFQNLTHFAVGKRAQVHCYAHNARRDRPMSFAHDTVDEYSLSLVIIAIHDEQVTLLPCDSNREKNMRYRDEF